ncbi:MAG: rhomboid family intramembrane serine protease [Thermoleophilia bacterium]
MLPIYDDVPTRRTPVLTIGLILACTLVFLYQHSLPTNASLGSVQAFECEWGVVPAHVINGGDPALDVQHPAQDGHDITCQGVNQRHQRWVGLITSLFLHGDWLHLLGNMLFLWIFGNNVEDRLGRIRFIPFYLLCGVVAGLVQAATDSGSGVPLIGASGAISGIIGAYLVLHPRAGVWTLIGMVIPWKIPAWLWGALYFGLQFIALGGSGSPQGGGIAYWAHIGGFLAGLVLVRPFAIGRRDSGPPTARRPAPGPSAWR